MKISRGYTTIRYTDTFPFAITLAEGDRDCRHYYLCFHFLDRVILICKHCGRLQTVPDFQPWGRNKRTAATFLELWREIMEKGHVCWMCGKYDTGCVSCEVKHKHLSGEQGEQRENINIMLCPQCRAGRRLLWSRHVCILPERLQRYSRSHPTPSGNG